MQMEPGMFTQPGFHVGMLMRRLIIDDEVDRQPWRDFLVDGFQKIKELVMAVFGYTRFDNSSRGNLQCSEQRGRSIALVIVCHGIPTPFFTGIYVSIRGSVESLNVSPRCGFKPRAVQIPCTCAGDTPDFAAIDRTDHCVAPAGLENCVNSTISAIFDSGITGLRPRPGATAPSSFNPS